MAVVLVALASTRLISKSLVPPAEIGRFIAIDGLRGYLAVIVFLHHSFIWYQYLRTEVWSVPESRLFVHFGQGGVALFFMITGFLFFSKILDSRHQRIDWVRLYASRVLRLVPMYLFSMALFLSVIYIVTRDHASEPLWDTVANVAKWLGFTIFGSPDINGLVRTIIVNAGVSWSLPYEWFFYVSLPLLAFFVGSKVSKILIILSVLAVTAFGEYYLQEQYYWLFLGGMLASVLVRMDRFSAFARGKLASWLILVLVVYIVVRYPYLYTKTKPTWMLVVVFCLIAGGNTIFGLLSNKISRAMGEMAYSIYLLHGIILFIVFKFVIGFSTASKFTPIQHWLTILLVTPVLIVICGITYKYIEKYFMQKTNGLAERLNAVRFRSESVSATLKQ
nr:acyltransferase [Pseudomonas sp. FSL R10-0399]